MSSQTLPEKFLGRFKLDRSENFDEYLASRGVNWILRKLICFTSLTKSFEACPEQPGRYNFYNHSAKENTAYEGWTLGQEFEGKGLDGKQHKITFWMLDDGETLAEKHIRSDEPGDQGETYQYTVSDQGQLVLKLENAGIIARRFFNRLQQ